MNNWQRRWPAEAIHARTLLLWALEWHRHDAGEVPHVYGRRTATHQVCVVCGDIDRNVHVRPIEAAPTKPEGAAT